MQVNKFLIEQTQTARTALTQLNEALGFNTLLVIDQNDSLVGTLTDGDIRRGLISGLDIDVSVDQFMEKECQYLSKASNHFERYQEFKKAALKLVPLVDENKKVIKVFDLSNLKALLPLDVVIMAGGIGERLKPLTNEVPKPLLKVGETPIIDYAIDRLCKFGLTNFYITTRYLGHMIKDHLGDGTNRNISISYFSEENPMGTIGGVKLIENFHHDHLLILNSDLLTNVDFENFYKMFLEEDAEMAVVSIPYQVNIPYAVIETTNNHRISFIEEKPTKIYYSNAGIYLLKRSLLDLVPKDGKFDATQFIEAAINNNKKVISYPFSGYWMDIGRLEDYQKAQEDIKHVDMS